MAQLCPTCFTDAGSEMVQNENVFECWLVKHEYS